MGKKVNCHGSKAYLPAGAGDAGCVSPRARTRVWMQVYLRGCECTGPESAGGRVWCLTYFLFLTLFC